LSFNKVILLLEKLLLPSCFLYNYNDLYYCSVLSFDQILLLLEVFHMPPYGDTYRDTHHYIYHSSILSLD